MKRRTDVWNHFTKIIDSSGDGRAKCNYCEQDFCGDSYGNGTSSLWAHFNSCIQSPHRASSRYRQLTLQFNAIVMEIWYSEQMVNLARSLRLLMGDLLGKIGSIDVLAIPVSTFSSEAAFSTEGRVLDCFRSSLTPKTLESLICTQNWLRTKSRVDYEENLEDLEKLENDYSRAISDAFSTTALD